MTVVRRESPRKNLFSTLNTQKSHYHLLSFTIIAKIETLSAILLLNFRGDIKIMTFNSQSKWRSSRVVKLEPEKNDCLISQFFQ